MKLSVRRLSYALGAEITGVDFQSIDDATFREIRKTFLDHSVLLFRGTSLTREQHTAFSRRFGELEDRPPARRLAVAGHPEIRVITNMLPRGTRVDGTQLDRVYQAELWHSDASQTLTPAAASLLRGVEIPQVGGDTMFANMHLAYETLSDAMKGILEGLEAIYVGGGSRIDDSTPERLAETRRLNRIAHPVVRTHPETGRKSLFVEEKLKQFVGMTAEESGPLIRFLCEHATRPQFVYRHAWQKNDLLIWDNRCIIHKAVNDYDSSQNRHMERATVRGLASGYVLPL